MEKVICSKCKKFVDYNIEHKQVTYIKAEAHCKECGASIWVDEIEEQNIIASTFGAMLASDTQKTYKKGLNSKEASDFVMVAQKIAVEKFAEKLKEKVHNYYPSIDSYCSSRHVILVKDIDELLKEYEK